MKLVSPLQWALLAVASVILLAIGGFGLSRALSRDEVMGNVVAVGVEIGGMNEQEATEALLEAEAQLFDRPATFQIRDSVTELEPEQVALDIDVSGMVEEAFTIGRDGNLSEQFLWWLGHFGRTEEIITRASIDQEAVEQVLLVWDESYVGNPPFPGGVAFEGTNPVPAYPRDGEQIDRALAQPLILDTLVSEAPTTVTLPITSASSTISNADVDQAVADARLLLAAPATLRTEDGELSIVFGVDDLASALVSEPVGGRIVLSFDPVAIEPVLEDNRGDLERPPVDARFEVEDTEIRIVPGVPGTLIDAEATADELLRAASSATRSGILPFEDGADPEVTTADLEALDIQHLVSRFTTYHDCCQNRVENIHLIADTVDGVIVPAGEEFSLNEFVGPRTTEKGYLEAGSIVAGELTDTVGGGVSQFATTFYNAVFWGGYEDVTHKPHSFYFSRYPEGIEATISWPQPELTFRNDSDAAVLIDTSYTDTSISVAFFGANDGRVVVGAHPIGGPTEIVVLAEGGPQARRIEASVSERFDFTDPRTTYRADPTLDVDQTRTVQRPARGWTVTVTRGVTVAGETSEQEWRVVYSAQTEIIEVHPCMMPTAGEPCPQETTTTTTTTTTVPAETTTVPPTTAPEEPSG